MTITQSQAWLGEAAWGRANSGAARCGLARQGGGLRAARALFVAVTMLLSSAAHAQTSGPVTVIDGDTFVMAGQRIRLFGIDAPERKQQCEGRDGRVYLCGEDAAAVMAELIRNRTVTCTPTGHSYNRIVATCSTESGDLGEQMVRRGWSVRVPRYDRECRYCAAEAEAKAAGRGIWAGRFEMPEDFRRARR